jgi:uncharacterized protein (TIGR03067 family)
MPASLSVRGPSARQAQAELQRLQGVWVASSGRRPAELLIAGNLFAVKFRDGTVYMGAFDLDLADSPPAMSMRIDEGPPTHRGKFARCIYELAGEQLRWCASEPGSEERLTHFPPEEDRQHLCLIFRRESPRHA